MSLTGLFIFLNAFSQYNYSTWSAGAGVGITRPYTDIQKGAYSIAYHINADYYFTPFITAGMETQFGTIASADDATDPHLRAFENSYKSFAFNGKVHLGQFIDYEYVPILKALKGFCLGTGIGIIQNDMKSILRIKPDGSNHVFPGRDNSTGIVFPFNVGISFSIKDPYEQTRFIISAAYQTNITTGEGLDGYNDSSVKFQNNGADFYTYTTIGLKYCFGPQGISYGR